MSTAISQEYAAAQGAAALFHVAGPRAGAVVEKELGVPAPMLEELQHALVGGVRLVWHRRLNLPGYDLFGPAELGQRLAAAGATAAGPATLEVLRVEAGVPADGIDMDAERFVVEVGRGK